MKSVKFSNVVADGGNTGKKICHGKVKHYEWIMKSVK